MTDTGFKKSSATLLYNLGFTANSLTLLGLALAGWCGWLAYQGHFVAAAAALLVAGLLDLMDGAVARVSGKADAFGGILDSTLDRYGDAFVVGGILFYCARTGHEGYAALAFLALVGSFAISYVRARAECELDTCRVGFWERGERIGLLFLTLLTANMATGIWILAVSTQVTAFQRVFESRRQIRAAGAGISFPVNRNTTRYAIQAAFWALAVVAFRLPF